MKKMSRPKPRKIPPGGDVPDWKRAQDEIIGSMSCRRSRDGKKAVNADRKRHSR
jgi:hypothetical protein